MSVITPLVITGGTVFDGHSDEETIRGYLHWLMFDSDFDQYHKSFVYDFLPLSRESVVLEMMYRTLYEIGKEILSMPYSLERMDAEAKATQVIGLVKKRAEQKNIELPRMLA